MTPALRDTSRGARLILSKHPRLQILTSEELLAGKRIDMPAQQDTRSFKHAPKAKVKKKDEARLF